MMAESLGNNTGEHNAGQDGNDAATPVESLGGKLREARERLGLSVADVADQIKFAPRQIEALEADDFMHLQGAAFLRGFVRSYAKILQLDMQSLLGLLPQTKVTIDSQTLPPAEEPFPAYWFVSRRHLIWLGGALLLAVIVWGLASWYFAVVSTGITQNQPKDTQVQIPVTLPVQIPAEIEVAPASLVPATGVLAPSEPAISAVDKAPVAQSAVVAPIPADAPKVIIKKSAIQPGISAQVTTLRMLFAAESWTQILDKDDNRLSSQINPPGSEFHFEGKLPLSLVIGHAASVKLYRDNEKIDLKPYINKYSEVARLTLE